MALSFDLAIRRYIAENVRPAMYDYLGKQIFVPETMSTSYVARSIFEEVRKDFPDYIIKFSSDNPRNPSNRAGPEELQIIDLFNNDPDLKRWQGIVTMGNRRYMAKFSARRMEPSCLQCHGDPEDAPALLIERYGKTAGFHRPLGKVIGMDTVAIPITRISEIIKSTSITTFAVSALWLFCFLLILGLVMKILVINRLGTIARHFKKAVVQDNYALNEPIELKGNDEISDLATGFNLLSKKLRGYHATLDETVQKRTRELNNKNRELEQEIAERREAESALRESEATLKSIFLAAPTGIGMVSNRVLIQANARLCDMVGYSAEELIGQKSTILYPSVDEYEQAGTEIYTQLDIADNGTAETRWKRKDGKIIHVLLSLTPVDTADRTKGVTFTALDITPQKKAETDKRELEELLAQSQKMEALGLLAGGVAHDLNNVLSGIVSYPDLILMDLAENDPIVGPIRTIRDSGKKAAAIVQDLLTLARRGVTSTEVLNLNAIVDEYLNSPEYNKLKIYCPDLNVKTRYAPDLLNIRGSSVHLKKTVMNLVTNASEAMPGSGGTIEITTSTEHLDRPVKGYEQIREGDYSVLRIKDSGIGIEDRDLKRIFEPFYTKKVMGRSGTGLGMSVVWGTVQDHDGYINVDSTIGEGTVFELFFPSTRGPVPKSRHTVRIEDYSGNGESILIVDDMKEQRQLTGKILKKLGYAVESAPTGERAVARIGESSFDLVILDMILEPGIDGLETYRRIRSVRPGQKVLIASGYSETDRVKMAQELGAGQYLKKPYTLAKIAVAVRDELLK